MNWRRENLLIVVQFVVARATRSVKAYREPLHVFVLSIIGVSRLQPIQKHSSKKYQLHQKLIILLSLRQRGDA